MNKLMITTAGFASVALGSLVAADVSVEYDVAGPGGNQVDYEVVMTGILDTANITCDFVNEGGFTWAGDLLIGFVAPDGTTVEFGGYDISYGYPTAGDFPSSWDSSSSGAYSHAFSLSAGGLQGGGAWIVQFADGYTQGASTDRFTGTLVLDGMDGDGDPYGGCCIGVGDCSTGTQADCDAAGGTYLGDNSDCEGWPCGGEPEGACCLGTDCVESTITDCEALGGGFVGDGTDCADGPCDADAGDACGTAIEVGVGATAFDTSTATDSGYGEPDDSQCEGTYLDWTASPDRWFRWTATGDGTLTVDTCDANSYDTSLVLYEGADCGGLVQVACNGDDTTLDGCQTYSSYIGDQYVTEGSTYYIRIGGWQAATGTGTLNITFSGGGTPMGGCCIGMDCSLQTNGDCISLGGKYQGDGTNCGNIDCGSGGDTGACCIGDQCTTMSGSDCTDFGGDYYGDGSSCNDVDCSGAPVGACCIDDACSEQTADDCGAAGGDYNGDGSSCNDVECDGGGNDGHPMASTTVGRGLVSGMPDSYTIDMYVITGEGGRLDAVAGTGAMTKMLASSGDFYQNFIGGAESTSVNPNLYSQFPDLEWDSRVTIGALDSSGNPFDENELQSVGIDWTEFENGGDMATDNGTWFVLPTAEQGAAQPFMADDCSMQYGVLIARLTVEDVSDIVMFEGVVQGRDSNGVLFNETTSIEAGYVAMEDCNDNGVNDVCDIANGTSEDSNGDGIPDECENNCPGDADNDGDADVDDILVIISQFGGGAGSGDVDGDGDVDVDDLLQVISWFGGC